MVPASDHAARDFRKWKYALNLYQKQQDHKAYFLDSQGVSIVTTTDSRLL